MLEELSLKLEKTLKKVRGQGKLTEKNISDSLREIRRVLLDADVNYKVAKEFIDIGSNENKTRRPTLLYFFRHRRDQLERKSEISQPFFS